MQTPTPSRFRLLRRVDVSGVSGTGHVANGVLWPDGAVDIRWLGDHPATAVWASLADATAIHGHDGLTRVEWIDDPTASPAWQPTRGEWGPDEWVPIGDTPAEEPPQ